jgi:SAM-dependent methyltransferase
MTSYNYDQGWSEERIRLAALASIYDDGTKRLLTDIGIGAGWHCLEVGAGEGSIAEWMSTEVGPSGRVLAIDLDPRFVTPHGVLEVATHDITAGPLEPGAFDLVHARAVVEWIADRPRALQSMVAALKPGGWLLVEDVDLAPSALGRPESELRRKAVDAFGRLAALAGADLTFGRQLLDAVTALGLEEIGSDARLRLQRGGDRSLDFERLSIRQLEPMFVAQQLLTADEVAQTLTELDNPDNVGYSPLMVAVWGRKPAS